MTPERYQQLKAVFQEACDHPPEARLEFVASACGDDLEMRGVVERLLEQDGAPDQRLEGSAMRASLAAAAVADPLIRSGESFDPACIGQYQIIRLLGAGGMGRVYEAQQQNPRRIVALKVIAGGLSDALSLRRFEHEVQMLARLQHPGIAQIFEAGTFDTAFGQQPYFALELVRGRALLEHARAVSLSVRDRLALFAKICDAVEHAHQKGVIHRDLKPANILVVDPGFDGGELQSAVVERSNALQPKILDFGVARVVDADVQTHTLTGSHQLLGTIAYMSPEQARGERLAIDTRSDVYALGVVLHQLLTGTYPYDVDGPLPTVVNAISSDEPIRPSVVNRELDEEIDTIILKCLSKEPARRYQSAGELAADIRLYLTGAPIHAKRDSRIYLLRKTLERYRVQAGALAAFVLLALGSSVVAWSLYLKADRATTQSQQRLHDALIAQAQAQRQTIWAGRRHAALDAVTAAANVRPSFEARNEAIAAMAVIDLKPTAAPPLPSGIFDPELKRCAVEAAGGSVSILDTSDGSLVTTVPSLPASNARIRLMRLSRHHFARFVAQEAADHLEIWRVPEGDLQLRLDDVSGWFDISPDERTLAVVGADRLIYLVDIEGRAAKKRVNVAPGPWDVTFDPTGRFLAVLSSSSVGASQIVNLETDETVPVFKDTSEISAVAWSADGAILAGADQHKINLWNLRENRSVALLQGHDTTIVNLVTPRTGSLLVSQSWDGSFCIWDLTTRRLVLRKNGSNAAISPDGRRIGAGVHGRSMIFQIEGDHEFRQITGRAAEQDASCTGAFDVDGRLIFLRATGIPSLRVYDAFEGRELAAADLSAIIGVDTSNDLAVDRAGRFMLTSGPNGVHQWPLRWTDSLLKVGPPVAIGDADCSANITLSDDGRWAAVASYLVQKSFTIIDVESRSTERIGCALHAARAHISPNAQWVAVASWHQGGCEIWDAPKRRLVTTLPVGGQVTLAFSPDNRWLATCDSSELVIWQIDGWNAVHRLSGEASAAMAFSRDSQVFAVQHERYKVKLIDLGTFNEIAILEPPDTLAGWHLTFSPDGATLATFTNKSNLVRLWDLRAVRRRLVGLRLDWNRPSYPASSSAGQAHSIRVELVRKEGRGQS